MRAERSAHGMKDLNEWHCSVKREELSVPLTINHGQGDQEVWKGAHVCDSHGRGCGVVDLAEAAS
eukprot:1145176-Pelagomonas_calceolata.AAC.3